MDSEGGTVQEACFTDLKRMVPIYLLISTIYSIKTADSNNYTSMITSRISIAKEKRIQEQPINPMYKMAHIPQIPGLKTRTRHAMHENERRS